jgi:tetratricopeptide (TPR) repeat protein
VFDWLNAREATQAGIKLADEFSSKAAGRRATPQAFALGAVESVRDLNMNFYKRAKLLNAFRWRLLENGVDKDTALETTQTLVSHLTPVLAKASTTSVPAGTDESEAQEPTPQGTARSLLGRAQDAFRRGDFAQSVELFREHVEAKPARAEVLNTLGVALFKTERYAEAEVEFRNAARKDSNNPDAQGNLGMMQLSRGLFAEAEQSLRRALKLAPDNPETRVNLGLALLQLARIEDARSQFAKVLRAAPRHAQALYGMGLIARAEGQFEMAGSFFNRAMESEPHTARAWAASAGLRKLGGGDRHWLEQGEKFASMSGVPALDRASVHFALGKYYDDTAQYAKAFENFRLANEALKLIASAYDRTARSRTVDDLIRVYTPAALTAGADGAGSDSNRPVFVVGMMRSGTSLVEQILASHQQVGGAGDLHFWCAAFRKHEQTVRFQLPAADLKKKLAGEYLTTLETLDPQAQRIVDKGALNADVLGLIHTVLPNARIIYVQRDPIDTCASCYFQPLSPELNFAMDLADLAHYQREHQRLIDHWRAVLPASSLLVVPYDQLVEDPAGWTRRMLEFLGLPWDESCLQFQNTRRPVLTASYWQVRQKIYRDSVGRWRHYRKYLGPLLELKPGSERRR